MAGITVGTRLRSASCGTEVMVIHAPADPVELTCGGRPMSEDAEVTAASGEPADGGTLLGKRYVDDTTGLEVLCTRPGAGVLSVDGRHLTIKAPKTLPASD
ncbi:MAG: Uncharacterized protein JWN52_2532 [Actinomycetia bacterium]|nr:Uncharacterized protein [Actinomycetes bacterium]